MSAHDAALAHLLLSLPLTGETEVARQLGEYTRYSLQASDLRDNRKVTSWWPCEPSYALFLPPQDTSVPVFSDTFKNTTLYSPVALNSLMYQYQ